ncbi:UNVERIFIED_CONTAM: hypothetical protein HDU68_003107 [Siphonaria sp. JEL0065]|nr:hypothetical protein HDU68_003107 [Siphonaria sp. JEL0065]
MQYVVIRPLMAAVALFTQLFSKFCSESMSPKYGHMCYTAINFVSVSICMFGLILLYLTIKDDISDHRPLPKFLSIKAVIFLTISQNMCAAKWLLPPCHLCAFPVREERGNDVDVQKTKWWKAFVVAFNPVDIWRELVHGVVHLIQLVSSYRAPLAMGKGTVGESRGQSAAGIVEEEVLEEQEFVFIKST